MTRTTAPQNTVGGVAGSPRNIFGILMIFGGLAGLGIGFYFLGRGAWPEAAYTIGGGAVVALLGVLWNRKAVAVPRRYSWRSLIVVVTVLGFLVWSLQPRPARPAVGVADIVGVSEPGDYRNQYFGFRVRYKADWQDVSAKAGLWPAERDDQSTGKSAVLLALVRSPTTEQNTEASLIFMAEVLPESDNHISGASYLKRTMLQLQQRRDKPRDVTEEPQGKIGGLTFDRVSFQRRWGDGEIDMTFWVTIKRGCAVVITGSYNSSEGLKAIEALLAQVSQETER